MTRKERYAAIIRYFEQEDHREAETELNYRTPFELLVSVILSAQCTDKRVNETTPALFACFPDARTMAAGSVEEIYELIKNISYPNNKSKHLYKCANKLIDDFGGEIPQTIEELQTLQGVGRKTAHVVASVLYNEPVMAVDTHVFRVSKRIGLANQNSKTPLAVEQQLMRHLPKDLVAKAHHWLILHGRYVCKARTPLCSACGIKNYCRYYDKLTTKK